MLLASTQDWHQSGVVLSFICNSVFFEKNVGNASQQAIIQGSTIVITNSVLKKNEGVSIVVNLQGYITMHNQRERPSACLAASSFSRLSCAICLNLA